MKSKQIIVGLPEVLLLYTDLFSFMVKNSNLNYSLKKIRIWSAYLFQITTVVNFSLEKFNCLLIFLKAQDVQFLYQELTAITNAL